MISVVVLTMNEASNLPRCLTSVAWSDDVLVLDSGSTDGTQDVARQMGARLLERPFDDFAGQRNYAMTDGALKHSWVLHLDADEVVTPELRDELHQIAASPGSGQDVWRVPSRLMFMGRWLRHAGMYPTYQVRFGHREALRFVQYGHGQREVQAPDAVATLSAPLDHYNFSKGIADWFQRHLRYAQAEAAEAARERAQPVRYSDLWDRNAAQRRRALKRLSYRLPFRPMLRFCFVYLLHMGFLDGLPGFHYARMLSTYQLLIDTLMYEQHRRSSRLERRH